MKYQDTWINGECAEKGKRNCADRYDIVKDQCEDFKHQFSVLDIGANNCYFGIRLIEDFNCRVTAYEFDHFEMRQKIVEANNTDRLTFNKKKLSYNDIIEMNKNYHFDLVLCLSVLHHLPGNSTAWLKELKKLGDKTIVEFALSDSKRTEIKQDYSIPINSKLLGYGDSHLIDNFKRPIVLL
jgi:2-polyprenyl-3-methyl-5-hydroxy-6-metoxy-1,4-benzoquinol methylase